MATPTFNALPSSLRLELPFLLPSKLNKARFPSFSLPNLTLRPVICRASESSTVPPKKRSSNNRNSKNNNKKKKNSKSKAITTDSNSVYNLAPLPSLPTSLPKPPAGFVVDERGKVLTASLDRLATLVSFLFFIFGIQLKCNLYSTCGFAFKICVVLWLWSIIYCHCAILVAEI